MSRRGEPRSRPAKERFEEKVLKTTTCWLWLGACDTAGYGNFWDNGKYVKAHRWSWESVNGPIPVDKQLDHLCRNHPCVNPEHLEPVSLIENLLRGDRSHLGTWQRERTQCPAGHLYDEVNTYITKDGRRMCRSCNRDRQRARRVLHG